jgi:hypothetical protein
MMLFRSLLGCLVATLPLVLAQDEAMSALATLPKCAVSTQVYFIGIIADSLRQNAWLPRSNPQHANSAM